MVNKSDNDNHRTFSVRLQESLIQKLDDIYKELNKQESVKLWNRTKLIERAVTDYFDETHKLPVMIDRRQKQIEIKEENRSGNDRQKIAKMNCARAFLPGFMQYVKGE